MVLLSQSYTISFSFCLCFSVVLMRMLILMRVVLFNGLFVRHVPSCFALSHRTFDNGVRDIQEVCQALYDLLRNDVGIAANKHTIVFAAHNLAAEKGLLDR